MNASNIMKADVQKGGPKYKLIKIKKKKKVGKGELKMESSTFLHCCQISCNGYCGKVDVVWFFWKKKMNVLRNN